MAGGVAQLVERLLCKQKVAGSTPVASTNLTRAAGRCASSPGPKRARRYPRRDGQTIRNEFEGLDLEDSGSGTSPARSEASSERLIFDK